MLIKHLKAMKIIVCVGMTMLMTLSSWAQKIDEVRMERDLEIAKNVLGTVIKQQGNRTFFTIEPDANYLPGYGVTFRLPCDMQMLFINGGVGDTWSISGQNFPEPPGAYYYENDARPGSYSQSVTTINARAKRGSGKMKEVDVDSARVGYQSKLVESLKDYMLDYSDLISQLPLNEKITITNRQEGRCNMGWGDQRSFLLVEANRADMAQFKQGKLSREQAAAKIRIVNSEKQETVEPDFELLSSIFSRLYRPDLSKTYFTNEDVYFERLKDFGVIYYFQVYSSNEMDYGLYNMPTVNMREIKKAERDKKVAELYPAFEKELKENVLEYGRTLRSLKSNEVLVFNVKLTRCESCGIPASLEVTIKQDVLSDYSSGKLSKEAALAKVTLKKGENQ